MTYNEILFFRINGLVGKWRWLDKIGKFAAGRLIAIMLIFYIIDAYTAGLTPKRKLFNVGFFFFFWALSWASSMLIALAVREPRPFVKMAQVKPLIKPIFSWKSFPSDHTLTSFLLFFIAAILNLPFFWFLLPLAACVAVSRVFVGVHYPFDIIAGFILSVFWAVGSWYVYQAFIPL